MLAIKLSKNSHFSGSFIESGRGLLMVEKGHL